MSQSAGYPGDFEHPEYKKVTESCQIITRAGKVPGIFANNIHDCASYINLGYQFIAYVADSFALKSFFDSSVIELISLL